MEELKGNQCDTFFIPWIIQYSRSKLRQFLMVLHRTKFWVRTSHLMKMDNEKPFYTPLLIDVPPMLNWFQRSYATVNWFHYFLKRTDTISSSHRKSHPIPQVTLIFILIYDHQQMKSLETYYSHPYRAWKWAVYDKLSGTK